MQIGSWIAIYIVIWWVCLFVVLPFKVRNQIEAGEIVPGSEPGAPALLRFGPKLLVTSLLAGVILLLLIWGISSPWIQEYWN